MELNTNKSLRLNFVIEGTQLKLIKTRQINVQAPSGENSPFEPISQSIIGHWAEIKMQSGETVYRRFLQNLLPLNYIQQPDHTKKIKKKANSFNVDIPLADENCELFIYEQSLPNPQTKQPQLWLHSKINLNAYRNLKAASA